MIDYIRLPRSALSDELWRNKDFGCLLWYLFARADEKGVSMFTAGEIETRLGISRQRLRTMLGKMQKSGLATNCQPTANQQRQVEKRQNSPLPPTKKSPPMSLRKATTLTPLSLFHSIRRGDGK